MVGSYAVYGPQSGNLVDALGNPISSYETGKFCHVYPWTLSDAAGHSVGVPITFDQASGQLRAQLPADFVNSAVYPLTLDPSFGYDVHGESVFESSQPFSFCSLLGHTASDGDVITAFTVYAANTPGDPTGISFAAYSIVSGAVTARLAAPVGPVTPGGTSPAEYSVGSLSQAQVTGTVYGVAATDAGGDGTDWYYDDDPGDTNVDYGATAADDLPSTWTSSGGSDMGGYRYSLWATYTAGARPAARSRTTRGGGCWAA